MTGSGKQLMFWVAEIYLCYQSQLKLTEISQINLSLATNSNLPALLTVF